jgi:citryl-CoA synthetase large subunit
MILYEYEGKKLLFDAGIDIPQSQLLTNEAQEIVIAAPYVLKAQVLSGKRADVGGIVMVEDDSNVQQELTDLFNETINKEKVEKILVEKKVNIAKEYYFSISYDTDSRSPIITFSESGGTGIEGRGAKVIPIDMLAMSDATDSEQKQEILKQVQNDTSLPTELLEKLINLFFDQDMTLLEINPLVQSDDGRFLALDAKVKLDDDAKTRHEDWDYKPRTPGGRTPTENEINAKKIDEGDYRGTAGSAYFDLEGDIAVLSSGGGISLTAMDALIKAGGKPANFTEYSGNPPKEKVVKLTKIVLNKPNIHGLWVVGTVAANFTDIHETLSGLIDGLREAEAELDTKFNFPIVIRRGGPRQEEAYEMLKNIKDFNLTLHGEETSVSQSAKVMKELSEKYNGL